MAGDPTALARAPETWPAAGSSRANRGPPGASPTLSLTLRISRPRCGATRRGADATLGAPPQSRATPRATDSRGRGPARAGGQPPLCPPRPPGRSSVRGPRLGRARHAFLHRAGSGPRLFPQPGGHGALGLALRGRHGTHECLSFCRSRGHAGASSPLAGLLSAPQPRLSRDCFTNGVEAAHRCGPRDPRGPWGPEGSGWIVHRERPRRSGPKRGPRPSGGSPRPQHVGCRP